MTSAANGRRWIGAQELLEDSLRLALRVLESGYRPNMIVGLWRGGTPVAIAVHEAFAYCGLELDHLPLRSTLYSGIDQRHAQARIEGLELLAGRMCASTRLLVIDDVFDTGQTMQQLMDALAPLPGERRIATLWWKPARNLSGIRPDYFVRQGSDWLVFPHELAGLGEQEIRQHKSALCADTLQAMRAVLDN